MFGPDEERESIAGEELRRDADLPADRVAAIEQAAGDMKFSSLQAWEVFVAALEDSDRDRLAVATSPGIERKLDELLGLAHGSLTPGRMRCKP